MSEEIEKPATSTGVLKAKFNCTPEQLTPVLLSIREYLGEGMEASQILQEAKPPTEDEADLLSVVQRALETDQPKRVFDKLIPDEYVNAMFQVPKLDQLLCDTKDYFNRYMYFGKSDSLATITAFWVAHTYVINYGEYTCYLNVNSPTPECGKSNYMKLLKHVVANARHTFGMTRAALVRTVAKESPLVTLLYDESDKHMNGEDKEAFIGILNSGFEEDGVYVMCSGSNNEPTDYKTFGAKAFSGVEGVPDSIRTRSIDITLQRLPNRRDRKQFRDRIVKEEAKPIRENWEAWARSVAKEEFEKYPELGFLDYEARAKDITEPLFQIAVLAGDKWFEELKKAVEEVVLGREETSSEREVLIQNIYDYLQHPELSHWETTTTEHLLAHLGSIEEAPWKEYGFGKSLSARQLADLLKPFNIKAKNMRHKHKDNNQARGYAKKDFETVFDSYLSGERRNTRNNADISGKVGVGIVTPSVEDPTEEQGLLHLNGTQKKPISGSNPPNVTDVTSKHGNTAT